MAETLFFVGLVTMFEAFTPMWSMDFIMRGRKETQPVKQ
jgi:hypothetical protein